MSSTTAPQSATSLGQSAGAKALKEDVSSGLILSPVKKASSLARMKESTVALGGLGDKGGSINSALLDQVVRNTSRPPVTIAKTMPRLSPLLPYPRRKRLSVRPSPVMSRSKRRSYQTGTPWFASSSPAACLRGPCRDSELACRLVVWLALHPGLVKTPAIASRRNSERRRDVSMWVSVCPRLVISWSA